jgi:hypothetical protein
VQKVSLWQQFLHTVLADWDPGLGAGARG